MMNKILYEESPALFLRAPAAFIPFVVPARRDGDLYESPALSCAR